LQAMRGIDLVAAVTVLAEIGDLSRFQTPRLAETGSNPQTAMQACRPSVVGR
jgi:Transposase IS116/IS110/IS902 family